MPEIDNVYQTTCNNAVNMRGTHKIVYCTFRNITDYTVVYTVFLEMERYPYCTFGDALELMVTQDSQLTNVHFDMPEYISYSPNGLLF